MSAVQQKQRVNDAAAVLPFDFHRTLLDNLSDGVYYADRSRTIRYWNRAAERLTGYTATEVVGRRCLDNILIHTDDAGCQLCLNACPLTAALDDGTEQTADIYLLHKNGQRVSVEVRVAPIYDKQGAVVGAVEIFNDNSVKLAIIEHAGQMEVLGAKDSLTGLANRNHVRRLLDQAAEHHHRYHEDFAVLFIDLDNFKSINDMYGHETGDAVLRAVAATLAAAVRASDAVGRWGGDEFIALLSNTHEAAAMLVAERCRGLVASIRVDCQGAAIVPTVSIGLACMRENETIPQLLGRADINLYSAKGLGRNRVTAGRTEELSGGEEIA